MIAAGPLQLTDSEKLYPKKISWLLDTYGKIWEHEALLKGKHLNGDGVTNVLISLIATAIHAGKNIYDYLLALQVNRNKIKVNVARWLPWTYQVTLDQQHTIYLLGSVKTQLFNKTSS